MKNVACVLLSIFSVVSLFAISPEDTIENEKIVLKIPQKMVKVDVKKIPRVDYLLAYKYPDNDDFELRINVIGKSLTADLDKIRDKERLNATMFAMVVAMSHEVLGRDENPPKFSFLPDESIEKAYNGKICAVYECEDCKSKFAGKFKHIMMFTFYKKNGAYVELYMCFKNKNALEKMKNTREFAEAFVCFHYAK